MQKWASEQALLRNQWQWADQCMYVHKWWELRLYQWFCLKDIDPIAICLFFFMMRCFSANNDKIFLCCSKKLFSLWGDAHEVFPSFHGSTVLQYLSFSWKCKLFSQGTLKLVTLISLVLFPVQTMVWVIKSQFPG